MARFLALFPCASLLLGLPAHAPAQEMHTGEMEMHASELADIDYPRFVVMGFGDVSYISSEPDDPEGFAIGQAVAHLSAQLDDSFGVFGEFSLTAHDDEYTIEAERMFVKYEFSDLFKLSAGRYHTPIGYWNSAFHHGAWLQTTVSRPEMAKFGSRIMPIHFVGTLIEGSVWRQGLGLSYMAGFGNGRHEIISRAGDTGEVDGESAWTVQVNVAPEDIRGLKAGIGFYTDRITPEDNQDIDETISSAYVVWADESPEILIEYLWATHELTADSSVKGDTTAWYAQFAYRLGGKWRDWKPYLRFEDDDIDDSDPLLGGQGLDYQGGILGVRWDFNRYAALKAEYRNEEFADMGRENNFRLQVSFVLADF
jgi:hypothetical protein